MFEIGQWIEGQYLVLERHRGRRWTLYIALDRMSENVFAIKGPTAAFPNFSPDIFRQKAKSWINLGEIDEIVTAFMLKEFDKGPHLFIQYMESPTLADVICSRHGRPLPIRQVVDIMKRIIEGMISLHKASFTTQGALIHGNLCLRNIIAGSDGVKITDIGIASAFAMPGGMRNADLLLRHTPCMAPERIENPAAESETADIYSFGALVYELVTGSTPTVIKLPGDPHTSYIASEPVPPGVRNRDCPGWLEEAILKCMAREPESRFQSFNSVKAFLENLEEEIEDASEPERRGKRTSRVARARGMAKKESGRLNHYYLGVEHMMLGILAEEEPMALAVFGDSVTADELRSAIFSNLPKGEGPWRWDGIVKTPRYRRIMKKAREIKREYADERMLPQHVLLAILTEGQSVPVRAIRDLGIDVEAARERLRRELGRRRPAIFVTDSDTAETRFAHKMTCVSDTPYFAPFIGRGAELHRAKDLLVSDRASIVVVGESGVGKTAFVQQLGCAIADDAAIAESEYGGLYKLRVAALLASDAGSDQIVDNFSDTLQELGKASCIVLVEDLPALLDISVKMPPKTAADLIQDAIASKELVIVGAATPRDYARCEAENETLFSQLEVINLHEPSDEEATQILYGARESFEVEHCVEISGKAIEAVIELAAQPEIARALPAAALELLDRACSAARLDDTEPQNGEGHAQQSAGRKQVTVEHVARAFEDTFSGDNIRGGTDREAYV